MNEDEIYRTSTQYRLWSFTSEALTSLRSTTNALAADRVRAAITRAQEARTIDGTTSSTGTSEGEKDGTNRKAGNGDGPKKGSQVECLTIEEEQKLVGFYCVKAMELADFCNFPTNVKVMVAEIPMMNSSSC